MIILGIDPGTLITGYGVIERAGDRLSLLDVGIIKNNPSVSMPLRLKKIYSTLTKVIKQFYPDEFAIETAFYSNNAQSALKIGQARGVSILAGINYDIPITEYSPREIKKAVTGKGAASKEQVQYMMMSLLKLKIKPKYFDSTDALAVAVCHAFRISTTRALRTSKNRQSRNTAKGSLDWKSYIEIHPEKVIRLRR
ncbi:MAG: crossover junction endodeoxyribonuclease RuvC [Bacteroidota bacterium]